MSETSARQSLLRRLGTPPKDFLPKLAMLGLPIGGAWFTVAWLWRSVNGDVAVNAKAVLAIGAGMISLASLFFWSFREKAKEIERLAILVQHEHEHAPQEPEFRSAEEEELLAGLWHHPGTQPVRFARHITNRDVKMISYQLECLERVKLVTSTLASYFRLTAAGRDYVVRRSLDTKPDPWPSREESSARPAVD